MVVKGYVLTKEVKTALSESTFLFFTCFILLRKSNPLHLKSLKKIKKKQRMKRWEGRGKEEKEGGKKEGERKNKEGMS